MAEVIGTKGLEVAKARNAEQISKLNAQASKLEQEAVALRAQATQTQADFVAAVNAATAAATSTESL